MPLRSTARLSVAIFRHVLGTALLLGALALLLRFGLQFPHPPKWDTLSLVIQLRRWMDPFLVGAAAWVGTSWAPGTRSLLPLGFGVGAWIVRAAVGSALERLERVLVASEREAEVEAEMHVHRTHPPLRERPVARAAYDTGGAAGPAAPAYPYPAPAAPAPPPAPAPHPVAAASQETPVEGTSTIMRDLGEPVTAPHIGRYEILEELGRGAMGVVYKARDPEIGRTVAIKSILAANLSDESIEKYKRRFKVEAMAAGKLSHPGIVGVHDLTEDAAGQPSLVMEFVEGTTLEKLVAHERLPLERVLAIVTQVAYALDYAHTRGVVHRDIKPANILVTHEGDAKVSDFGIAKLAGTQLTSTGQIIGTPAFMSPEQFMGSAVDARSDIFSLGSMLYWLCTGEKAFPGETITAISYKVVHMTPVAARQINPSLPPEIDTILSRCLAKNPAERYQSGRALAADLEACRAGRPLASASSPAPAADKRQAPQPPK